MNPASARSRSVGRSSRSHWGGATKREGLFTREVTGDKPYFIFDITKARYEAGGRALVM